MAKVQLTDRQRDVYELVRSLIQERGYGPTVREIGEQFGIKSPNGVMCHLRALERKGLITRKANKSRAIELTGENARSITGLPTAGMVSTMPTEVDLRSTDVIDLGKIVSEGDRFIVQLSGDSLAARGILDGDYIVIAKSDSAQPGQLVAVAPEEGKLVVRYWHPGNNRVELRAASSDVAPMIVSDPTLIGIVVAAVRATF